MGESILSINLAEDNIKIAKASNSSGKIDTEILAQQKDTPTFFESETDKVLNEEITALKKMIDSLNLSKRPANIVLPDGFTYSQIVKMPRLKEKELLSAIKYQADQFIPMPLEDASLDLEIIHEDKSTNKLLVLIIAAPQKLIQRVQSLAEQVGLYLETVENELSSTGRFLTNFFIPNDQTGCTIFINFGYTYTSFYLFDHKLKLLIDSHTFPAGLSVFIREAQVDINIDVAKARQLLKKVGFTIDPSVNLNEILQPTVEAMCNELKKFINSVQSKFKLTINSLQLFNLAQEINSIDKKIESCISLPVRIFDPVAITKKTNAVVPYLKDLPYFISTIGGSLL